MFIHRVKGRQNALYRVSSQCWQRIDWNVSWSQIQAGAAAKVFCDDKIRDLCEHALDSAVGLTRQVTKGRQMLSRGMSHCLREGSGWCRWAYRCRGYGGVRGEGGGGDIGGALSRRSAATGGHWGCWADMLVFIRWGIIIDDQPGCRIWESLVRAIMQP